MEKTNSFNKTRIAFLSGCITLQSIISGCNFPDKVDKPIEKRENIVLEETKENSKEILIGNERYLIEKNRGKREDELDFILVPYESHRKVIDVGRREELAISEYIWIPTKVINSPQERLTQEYRKIRIEGNDYILSIPQNPQTQEFYIMPAEDDSEIFRTVQIDLMKYLSRAK